jgi:hypothetical protein
MTLRERCGGRGGWGWWGRGREKGEKKNLTRCYIFFFNIYIDKNQQKITTNNKEPGNPTVGSKSD